MPSSNRKQLVKKPLACVKFRKLCATPNLNESKTLAETFRQQKKQQQTNNNTHHKNVASTTQVSSEISEKNDERSYIGLKNCIPTSLNKKSDKAEKHTFKSVEQRKPHLNSKGILKLELASNFIFYLYTIYIVIFISSYRSSPMFN